MKQLKSTFVYSLAIIFSCAAFAADVPPGFEEPGLIDKVMAGEIVKTNLVDTATEFRTQVRAFFKKVTPEAYIALATNHPKFADLFAEVEEGKTLKTSADKLEFDYVLDVIIKLGPITQHFYPELHQKVTPNPDAISEAKVEQAVTNYKDKITYSAQSIRLIPYQDGILVFDDVHFVITKDASAGGILKKNVTKLFNSYTEIFRKELGG